MVESTWLQPDEWLAVLRIALGLWWLESFRHKDLRAWWRDHAGIRWAGSVARDHRSGVVRRSFAAVVEPRPRAFTAVVLGAELSLGLGITLGFLTPVALAASALLSLVYLTLMIHDWAEQGQNLMMLAIAVVALGAHAWQRWSLDAALGWF